MMNGVERLKAEILRDYPRYTEDDRFSFCCHTQISCFNKCCANVNIFLSPYDILRMKNHLGMTSEQFLQCYTLMPTDRHQKYPVVLLEMTDAEDKHCPFVSDEEGCTIYEDRPWACRMYPVGLATPAEDNPAAEEKEFYFLIRDAFCRGHEEDKGWTIREWVRNQGIEPYNEMGRRFKEVAMHKWFENGKDLSPEKIEMFFMVCYNLDTVRRMVFESSFLEKFEVDEARQEHMRRDDVELLKFGFDWLKFSLFGEPTITIKPCTVAAAKARSSA
jgi:Fe-S-cluster containining protein